MSKVRVLIVDDSVVIRKVLSEVIHKGPDMEVAGVAANASIALAKIPQVNPDAITLDVEMPGMDEGLALSFTLLLGDESYERLQNIVRYNATNVEQVENEMESVLHDR